MNTSLSIPHRVVIIGAGFGGLNAAKALAHAPVQVTLIDRNNYHLFQPLLYQVATAAITPEEIAYPVRGIFRGQKNFSFHMGSVHAVDLERRQVRTSSGDIAYDTLIIAAGGQTNSFGIDSVARNSFGLKGLDDAASLRNHLLEQFELASQETDSARRRAHLTFVIAGGGPTGVETAGAIYELVHMVLQHDALGIQAGEVHVILLEGMDRLLAAMPPELSREAMRNLSAKGVEVRFSAQVASFDGKQVYLKSGEDLPAFTLVWAAGVRAVPLLAQLGLPVSRLGQVMVEPTLQAPGHPEVYVIGDAASLAGPDGSPLPMVAPVAIQGAQCAAANLLRSLRGEPLREFVYHDPGTLATIGRSQAVARLWGINFKGFLAWVMWLGVHLIQLIGFRNRLLVLINWAWDYLFYDRAVRLILPVNQEKPTSSHSQTTA
jgi:NADH:ubiquinone reductase (H+-translocating)